jgi:hypothetical protein
MEVIVDGKRGECESVATAVVKAGTPDLVMQAPRSERWHYGEH